MNKKFLLLAFLILGSSTSSFAQQEESYTSRTLIKEQADYGAKNQTYNKYETTWKGNKFGDNWTISVGGGAQRLFGKDNNVGNFTDNITFAPQFALTKYFSPSWGLRLSISGGSLHGYNDGDSGVYRKWNHGTKNYLGKGYIGKDGYPSEALMGGDQNTAMLTWDPQWTYLGYSLTATEPDKVILYKQSNGGGNTFQWNGVNLGKYYMKRIRYVQANIDFLFDLLNVINGYNPKRFFEVSPFGGVGLYNAFAYRGSDNYMSFGAHAGFIFKFRVTERLGLNAELSGSLVPDDFEGITGDGASSSGIAQAIGSISYKIGKTNWDLVEPVDYELINTLNNQINDLRDENRRLRETPQTEVIVAAPPVVPIKPENNDIKFLPDPVFFKINQSTIDNEQWSKIDKAATWLANHPDQNVIITGYADKETGSSNYNMKLSERRAKAVAEVLIQRYNINPLRVSISWSGSEIQPFKINNWNRAVIFVIE